MQRRTKYLLVYSIIYWIIVIIGIALFSVSFQKVPISTYYTSGLYDVGVGYYFINFPSIKQQIIDNQVDIINQNLEKLTVTYSLFYRYSKNYKA